MSEYAALIAEIRRNRALIVAYKGAQPADEMIRIDIEAAFRFLVDDDKAGIVRITERMRLNLPPPNRR